MQTKHIAGTLLICLFLLLPFRLQINGCRTWVEVVLDFYVDYLREYSDAALSVRAPTITGQWQSKAVTYATFALEETYQPTSLFREIIEGTVEFNPAGLLRAVKKARAEIEKANAKEVKSKDDSEEEGDEQQEEEKGEEQEEEEDNASVEVSDKVATGISSTKKDKKTRLPPLQTAFEKLVVDLQAALSNGNLDELGSMIDILSSLVTVAKVTKQKDFNGVVLSSEVEKYVRDADRIAKEKAKEEIVVQESDQSISSGPASVAEDEVEEVD